MCKAALGCVSSIRLSIYKQSRNHAYKTLILFHDISDSNNKGKLIQFVDKYIATLSDEAPTLDTLCVKESEDLLVSSSVTVNLMDLFNLLTEHYDEIN